MNINDEREYWSRAVREVLDATGETIEELAARMQVSPRQIANWKAGQRPTGIPAFRFYEYRKYILEVCITSHGTAPLA